MTNEQANFLKRVSDDQGNQECDIHETYSGRGMYGRQTTGIVVDSVPRLMADVLNYMSDKVGEGENCAEWNGCGEIPPFDSFRIDSMGHSTILY